MNILKIKLTSLVNILLKISLPIIIIAGIIMCFASFQGFHIASTAVFTLIMLISLLGGYKIVNSGLNCNKKILIILLMGAVVRILWLLNTNNTPTSDFSAMYEEAGQFVQGNRDVLKGLSYPARFPHMIMTILYMALIRYIFPYYSLVAIKMVNLILGIGVLILLYAIAEQIFKDKKYQLYTLLLGSLYPPFITYTSVFCSENLAMPLYLLSILLFLKGLKKQNHMSIILILSSAALGIGNLFRMIAVVILIAYVIYLLVYSEQNIFKKFQNIICITLPYMMVLILVSSCLQRINITDTPLWRGKEPKITSVLRGTNIESLGMWNAEDAQIGQDNLGDYDEIEKKSKEIIYERLTTTPPLKIGIFYIEKLASQWCMGDFSGSFWTQNDMDDDRIIFKVGQAGSMPFQVIYVIMLIMAFFRLINKDKSSEGFSIDLFHLILIGYIGAYLITENQCRYGYIISWIFIILGIDGIKAFISSSVSKKKSNEIEISI